MIREAREQDIPAFMEIYNEAILNTTATFDTEIKTMEERHRWFLAHQNDEKYVIFAEELDGEIAGYASLSQYRERKAFDGTVEISVYIGETFRGRKIGSGLMEYALAYARKTEAIRTVISLVTSENQASIHLHDKFGFVYCGQIKNAGVKFGKSLSLNAYEICYQRQESPQQSIDYK